MLKSFDIADNFTGILSAGVVAAIPPVANTNNLPLMSSNTATNNVLDTTSMKNLKSRPHPYLREQTPHKLQSQQPQIQQTTTLQQQQLLQQQQHLQQQQQQLQQLQEQQQRIQEQITSVGGVISSVSGFGLSAMNSSPPLSVLTATAAAVPMEMPIAPMIKADPDAANNNENNSLELLVNGGNMGGGGGAGSILNNNSSSNSGSGNPGTEDGSSNGGGNGCSVVVPDVSVSLTQTNPLELESLEINPKDVDEFSKDQPDPDNIKMFVGQIPKSMDETQLRKMFELYGRVHTINVLRDKLTLQSRGCCFVTYYTRKAALKAQDALHNIKTLDGMHHPIQMKPADSENRNERKLFVGMLNKKFNESEVRQLFAGHGTIEECTVLRDQNGQSKGCAFVTFSTKQAAIGAIKSLHQSQTMEGCSAPLVVKFADTQKEKDQKKLQQLQATLVGNGLTAAAVSSSSVVARTNPTVQALATPSIAQSAAAIAATPSILAANPPQQASPYLAADAMATPSQMQLFQQLQTFGIHPQFLQGLNFPPDHSATTLSTTGGLIAPMSMQGLVTLATLNPSPHHTLHTQHPHLTTTHPHLSAAGLATSPAQPISAQLTNTTSGPTAAATLWPGTESLTSPYAQSLTQLSNGTFAAATAPLTASALTAAAAGVAGKQIEGPEGSNLFIYHLPQEFNDTDLATTFLPFGNVLSAKVFIDKQTNLSKCFGFVSYDNPHSANAAIQAMHGFQIGTKRLKVQLKRSKDAAKPY